MVKITDDKSEIVMQTDSIFVCAENVASGVYQALEGLNFQGQLVPGNEADTDKDTMMKESVLFLEITDPFVGDCVPKCILTDLAGLVDYEIEFVDGSRDDKADMLGYTYHALYESGVKPMIDMLKNNRFTRQAVLPVGSADFYGVEDDKPCLMDMFFKVRADGRLWVTAVFRSNDAVKAFPMNVWAIARLLKRVSEEVGIPAGGINYIANSFHCYPKDREKLVKYVRRYRKEPMSSLAWSYDEYMEAFYEKYMRLCTDVLCKGGVKQ